MSSRKAPIPPVHHVPDLPEVLTTQKAEIAGMCKLETGFASVEMLYVVVTAGVIYGLSDSRLYLVRG